MAGGPDIELLSACKKGHIYGVLDALEAGANPSARSTKLFHHYGSTPLTLAATNGRSQVVAVLLDHGADPPTFLFRKRRDVTAKVQDIVREYLGIEKASVVAFEGDVNPWKLPGMSMLAFAVPGDGIGTVAAPELSNNAAQICEQAALNMENVITGASVKFDIFSSERATLYNLAGFRNTHPVDQMYCYMYEQLLRNNTCIELHEGIHAIHFNNSRYCRTSSLQYVLIALFFPLAFLWLLTRQYLPIVGPVQKARWFGFSVETEAMAYKVSLDVMTDNFLTKAGENVDEVTLSWFKQQFRDRNSQLAKTIIEEWYVKPELRGYGSVFSNVAGALALLYLLIAGFWSRIDHQVAFAIRLVLLAIIVDRCIRIPFSLYFCRKIKVAVEVIDALAQQLGGAGKAFYEGLGLTLGGWKRMLRYPPGRPNLPV